MTAHLSPEARQQVVTLTVAGYTAPRIASFLGVCVRTVQRIRIQEGVAQPPPVPFTEDEKRRAGQLLDDGASYEETARTIGRSVRPLRKHFPGRGWTREQCTEFGSLRRRYRQVS